MNRTERIERLNKFIAEDRVIRNAWTDGKGRACLLAAMSPEVAEAKKSSACPADFIPNWFAELTVWIDDRRCDTLQTNS